jgi:photosystem II stability/assembly factor-like uncharacterized protein
VTQDTLNDWIKYPKYDTTGSASLDDIWFTDENNGIAAGLTMMSSGDGGKTWTYIPNTRGAWNIQFLDSLNGYAMGFDFQVTTDGGKTWTLKNGGGALYFQFITSKAGFMSNGNTVIWSTHNDGDSWDTIYHNITPGPVSQYFPFYFLDTATGYTVMNNNFYKTSDGGTTWKQLSIIAGNFASFYKMQFLDTLNGYCGTPAGLLKTVDGGKSWNNCFAPPSPLNSLFVIQFFDVNNGYCMTSNGIYKTVNGGQSWTTSCKIGNNKLVGIHFLSINNGWACTQDGFVLRLKQ